MASVEKRIIARFEDFEQFKRALGTLKAAGVEKYEAYSPVNIGEMGELVPPAVSAVRGVSTVGAIVGLVSLFYLCVATSLIYKIVVGGKPPVSNVPFVVLAYEGTILFGAVAAFLAGLYFAKVFRRDSLPEDVARRFTGDSFGIEVVCLEDKVPATIELLSNAGAVEISEY